MNTNPQGEHMDTPVPDNIHLTEKAILVDGQPLPWPVSENAKVVRAAHSDGDYFLGLQVTIFAKSLTVDQDARFAVE